MAQKWLGKYGIWTPDQIRAVIYNSKNVILKSKFLLSTQKNLDGTKTQNALTCLAYAYKVCILLNLAVMGYLYWKFGKFWKKCKKSKTL